MNVTVIASMPHMSTGPLFDRLYAVEPDGVAWMIPSASTRPERLAADRPLELRDAPDLGRRGDDVVDGDRARRRACAKSSVGSSITT